MMHVYTYSSVTNVWTDISIDSNGNGPHTDDHALAVDASGNIIIGNDGGVWRWNPIAQTWTDINGDLTITTFNGVDTNPTNPNLMLGASQDNGTELFTGGLAWTSTAGGDGGLVFYNPSNPLIAYHVENGILFESTDGGNTWPNIVLAPGGQYFPFLVDPLNPSRLLVGGGGNGLNYLEESLDGGNTWVSLGPPINVVSVAAAEYQGPTSTIRGSRWSPTRGPAPTSRTPSTSPMGSMSRSRRTTARAGRSGTTACPPLRSSSRSTTSWSIRATATSPMSCSTPRSTPAWVACS